jgi:transcriptional regulator with XRE-family HTH domain
VRCAHAPNDTRQGRQTGVCAAIPGPCYGACMHSRWDKPRFRDLLAQAMATAGMSQREAADLAGVSHSQISRWMSGAHQPGYENIRQLGAALRDRQPGMPDITAPLLEAAGYDEMVIPSPDKSGAGSDGRPLYSDPDDQQIADQVWEAAPTLDPAVRRGAAAMAVDLARKRRQARNVHEFVRRRA